MKTLLLLIVAILGSFTLMAQSKNTADTTNAKLHLEQKILVNNKTFPDSVYSPTTHKYVKPDYSTSEDKDVIMIQDLGLDFKPFTDRNKLSQQTIKFKRLLVLNF